MMASADLATRLTALGDAARLAQGRASDDVVRPALDLVQRAGERLAISGDHTVVALAGATGSGKSSTFNAVSGTQWATTGVQRPTTSEAMSVSWGAEQPARLLDWLGVTRRHLVVADDSAFANLVLLDLPDHDSTEVAHKVTVDRLVNLVDMLVWVVDPQKYADAALHDGYLKPLADHAGIMVVVLNQIDRLTDDQRARAVNDLRRLLDSEGLRDTPVLTMSAITGEGVGELRQLLVRTVRDKAMTAKRFSADVSTRAAALASELGRGKVPRMTGAVVDRLNDATAEAAGVPIVTDGVLRAWRHRGVIATGWPMVKWVRRFRPDPLRSLRVGIGLPGLTPTDTSRTSLPRASSVQKARLDASLRGLIEAASEGVPRGWLDSIRAAARGNERVLADRLDASIARADLRMDSGHGWWVVVTILQWLLFVAMIVGGLWLVAPLILLALQVPIALPSVDVQGWPLSTLLLVGGAAAGILLSLVSRLFVELGARSKARRARGALMAQISEVTSTEVVAPVQRELDRLAGAREAVGKAR